MRFWMFTAISCLLFLVACSEKQQPETERSGDKGADMSSAESPKPGEPSVAAQTSGGVTIQIMPKNPTVSDCLSVQVTGQPGRHGVRWLVNGEPLPGVTGDRLCGDSFKRGDQVTAEIGTLDVGASQSVTIANSPPRVVNISSIPAEIFAGKDVSVTPVAEDADGDTVDFAYLWLINGEADSRLTEATLPGNSFTKGDTIQVQIVPNDFYEDGPAYLSYVQLIPNAPPEIVSTPPQGISSLDYRYQVEATDSDDSVLVYRLAEAPVGMTIGTDTGLIEWSLADIAPGVYSIVIIVADPEGAEAAQGYTLTIGSRQ